MLTLFSVPKAFIGKYSYIQENAIRSWIESISPQPEIILLGNEHGVKEICSTYNLQHIPNIKTNSFGTPLLNDIFYKAKLHATNNILMYINCDIVILENLNKIVKLFSNKKPYLASGRRYELLLQHPIDFKKSNWNRELLSKCNLNNLKNSAWMDYFIFPKQIFDDIPPFALGRTFWDKWLIWKATSMHYRVIDITDKFHPIHQTHGYFFSNKTTKSIWEGEEAIENIRLAGGWSHGMTLNSKTSFINNILNFPLKIVDHFPSLWPLLLKIRRFKNAI